MWVILNEMTRLYNQKIGGAAVKSTVFLRREQHFLGLEIGASTAAANGFGVGKISIIFQSETIADSRRLFFNLGFCTRYIVLPIHLFQPKSSLPSARTLQISQNEIC